MCIKVSADASASRMRLSWWNRVGLVNGIRTRPTAIDELRQRKVLFLGEDG